MAINGPRADCPLLVIFFAKPDSPNVESKPIFQPVLDFLDTQGCLAKQRLDVIVTHALISGSSGVIDEKTFLPNANFWWLYCGGGIWVTGFWMLAPTHRDCIFMLTARAASRAV